MPIVEEITHIMQVIWAWFASFADIGDMFTKLWEGFLGWFS